MTRQQLARALLRIVWLAVPVVTVIAFVLIELQRTGSMITISNLDYFPLLERGAGLSFASLDNWVHRAHPVGYPWLIRLGLELGWDAERVGQAWSIAGGVLGLCGTWLLGLSVFRDKRFAGLVTAYVATTGLFLYYASVEGNDMLAAGLQLLSLGVLAASLRQARAGWSGVFVAGLIAGLAYLVRYNGLVTALASGVWLAAIALHERKAAAWKAVGLYGAAFLLASALQWIPSWVATGTPLYNDQGQNVWFHVYGQTDFIREFNQAPAGITLIQVLAMDPYRFVRHWWDAFQGFWVDTKLTLLDAPLKLFGQAGLVFLLLARGPVPIRRRGLLGVFVLAHLASLSLMRLDRRFLITMIPLLTIGATYLFASLIPPGWEHRRASLPFNLLVLLAGLVWTAQGVVGFVAGRPAPDWTVIQASNVLHAAGMRSAAEVLSTHTRLQDASALERTRFTQAYWAAPDRESIAGLVETMRLNGWRFFVYDRDAGPIAYPALQDLLSPETRPAGLAPIYIPPERDLVIYRLVDENSGCASVDAHFEGGITLTCYEAHISQAVPAGSGRRIGLYLDWQTDSPLTASLKVFVHVLDAGGKLVAQDDSLPVVWTVPTPAWAPGEVIVDFHQFPLEASLPPGDYTLQAGLYDEGSGVRMKRLDASGKPLDDKMLLSTITLPPVRAGAGGD